MTVNALVAAQEVLVPLQAEYLALEGLTQLTNTIDMLVIRLNPQLRFTGILPTMVTTNTLLGKGVLEEVRAYYGDIVTVSYTHLTLPTILRSCRSRWSPYH